MDRRRSASPQVDGLRAHPLVTYYLQKNGEPEYHLVDEPFDYDKVKI